MKVLTLDIASNTGVCVGTSGADPRAWSVYLGDPPDERRFSNVLKLTSGLIDKNKPDLIVVEAAIGGAQASQFLAGLVSCVRGVAYNRGVPCHSANIATVRKHFLGKHLTAQHFPHLKKAAARKAIKQAVIDRCELLGWHPDDDDCADAFAIWDYACATYARKYQAKPSGELFSG